MNMSLLQVLQRGMTVGEVAGIISGAASIVSLTLPLFVAFILVWSIRNKRLNASTWSTAAKTLQGTLWPTILRSDSARTKSVARRVNVASTTLTVAIVLQLAVHIITPLPLIQQIQPRDDSSTVSFKYAPDLTFFGQGTAPRPLQPLSRTCGTSTFTDCTPSNELFDKLSSGSVGTTVAGPKDIQFRNMFFYQNQSSNNEQIAVGLTLPMQNLLLNTNFTIVEGLIVDPNSGGVGFRNHTIPIGLQLGATWQEDILWIQPETVCTANNFSIHFPFGNSHVNELFPVLNTGTSPNSATNSYLKDDGGFAYRNWSIPSPRWDIYGPDSLWNITGPIPDLTQRSFLGAWWDNFFTAAALNISANSTTPVGTQYGQHFTNYTIVVNPFAITISNIDGAIFDQAMPYNLYKFFSANLDRYIGNFGDLIPGVEEAFNFTSYFLEYNRRCFGFDDFNVPDPLKPYIRCGNLYGVAVPDDPDQTEFQIDSMVGQPAYTCASSVKVTIKTVEFTFNGTSSLSNIVVSSITDKNYTNTEDEPLWGVEKVDPSQNLNISDINLLWGLVSDIYENDTEISTIRGNEFYLPVAYANTDMSVFKDSLAAASVFTAAWNTAYTEVAWIAGISFGGLPSYSGNIQYSLFLKWRELSNTTHGAATILNLIWTDLVASAVVGTTTGFEKSFATQDSGVLGQRQAYEHHSVVVYGNLLFAIPAFLVLCLWAGLLVITIGLLITRKVTGAMLSYYMNHSSLGRAVLNAEHPDPAMTTSSSKDWTENFGSEWLAIRPYDQHTSILQSNGQGISGSLAHQHGESGDGSMELTSLSERGLPRVLSTVELPCDEGL